MEITRETILRWRWKLAFVFAVCVPIFVVDVLFFANNLLKLSRGGYVPVLIAGVLVTIMLIWQWGRQALGKAFFEFWVREGKKIECMLIKHLSLPLKTRIVIS